MEKGIRRLSFLVFFFDFTRKLKQEQSYKIFLLFFICKEGILIRNNNNRYCKSVEKTNKVYNKVCISLIVNFFFLDKKR